MVETIETVAQAMVCGCKSSSQKTAERLSLTGTTRTSKSPQQDWYMNYDIASASEDNRQNDVFDTEMENAFLRDRKADERTGVKILADQIPSMPHSGHRLSEALFPPEARRHLCPLLGRQSRGCKTPCDSARKRVYRGLCPHNISTTWKNGFGDLRGRIRIIKDGSQENISSNLGDATRGRFYNNINPMSDRR